MVARITQLFLSFLVVLTFNKQSLATPTSNTAQLESDLEVRVWQAREDELPDIEKSLIRMMQNNPDSAYVHYLLSHLYLEKFSHSPGDLGLLRQSSELAQQSAELDVTSDLGVIATCELLDVTGQTDKAITLLSKAIGSGINISWRSYFMLGKLKAEKESFEKVLELYKQSLAYKDSKSDIIIPHIIATIKSKNSEDEVSLEKEFVTWNSMFPNIMFLESLAGVMVSKKNYRNAEKIYQLVLKDHPDRIETRINYAILQLNFLNKSQSALKELGDIAKTNKTKLSDEYLSLIYGNMAMAYLEQNQPKLAQEYFLRVYTLSVEDYSLAIAQAAYLKFGKADEFTKLLNYIVSEISGSGLSFALLGETYAEQLNNPDKAIEAYQNAILIDNKVSQYHNGLGLAYHKKKEFNIALKHFSNAVKIDPSDAVARYNLACMFSRLGNPSDALASLQEAFALSPDLIATAQNDPDLNNVRNLSAFEKIISEVNSIDDDIEDALSH